MSKLTNAEKLALTEPRPLKRVMSEAMRIAEMKLAETKISGRIFEYDCHTET